VGVYPVVIRGPRLRRGRRRRRWGGHRDVDT